MFILLLATIIASKIFSYNHLIIFLLLLIIDMANDLSGVC